MFVIKQKTQLELVEHFILGGGYILYTQCSKLVFTIIRINIIALAATAKTFSINWTIRLNDMRYQNYRTEYWLDFSIGHIT